MKHKTISSFRFGISLLLPIIGSLIVGSIIILVTGNNPIDTFINLFDTGFSCHASGRCALLSTIQFATPLIFTGLSATIALRANFISLGQAGQMLLGAAAASWIGANINLPFPILPLVAILGAAFVGAIWGLVPALLHEYLGMNEIITTLLFNPLAVFLLGFVRIGKFPESARLVPLIPRTKITIGFLIALITAWVVYLLIWKTKTGLEIRNTAQAPRFSNYGGITKNKPIILAIMISGALAGIASAVEVLGVHYKFVSAYTAVSAFDGLIIAFAGRLHPLGVLFFAFLVGGLRNGTITGFQIRSGIPRELGGALIAFILLFSAMVKYYRENGDHPKSL